MKNVWPEPTTFFQKICATTCSDNKQNIEFLFASPELDHDFTNIFKTIVSKQFFCICTPHNTAPLRLYKNIIYKLYGFLFFRF